MSLRAYRVPEDELEQVIREGGSSHVEQLIYNMTLVCPW